MRYRIDGGEQVQGAKQQRFCLRLMLFLLCLPLLAASCSKSDSSGTYSIKFWFDGWSMFGDNFPRGRPDLFVRVQIEGQQPQLIPELIYNYQGNLHILNFRCPRIAHGNAIAVHFMADHSVSDAIWKRILQSRIQLDGSLNAMSISKCVVKAGIHGSTEITLLDSKSAEELVISGPTTLRTAELKWPYFRWPVLGREVTYTFRDPKKGNKEFGAVTLREL